MELLIRLPAALPLLPPEVSCQKKVGRALEGGKKGGWSRLGCSCPTRQGRAYFWHMRARTNATSCPSMAHYVCGLTRNFATPPRWA